MIENLRKPPTNEIWNKVMQFAKDNEIPIEFICAFCLGKIRNNLVPPTAAMNKMNSPPVPAVIKNLNNFEKMLIQRIKVFKVVTRMTTVAKRKLPNNQLIQKVVGKTFHLPLPLEKTLNKILKPEDPIMPDQELFILIRILPSKQRKCGKENKRKCGSLYLT